MALAFVLVSLSLGVQRAWAWVDCDSSPNCGERGRKDCDPDNIIPNACGPCKIGSFGGDGPTNSFCLSKKACGAVFPGSTTCAREGTQLPLLVPLGQCVCDSGDGLRWPTAAGACAKVDIARDGSGFFSILRCTSDSCDDAGCVELGTWEPLRERDAAGNLTYECKKVGGDMLLLAEDCDEVAGDNPESAFCGHPGLVNTGIGSQSQHVVKCGVAPRCPNNVVATDLQTCCTGTQYSTALDGHSRAMGFCEKEPVSGRLVDRPIVVRILGASGLKDSDAMLQGTSDPFCEGQLQNKSDTYFKTSVKDDDQDPAFNAATVIKDPEEGDVFEFRCWDRDFDADGDDLLGKAELSASEWQEGGFEGEIQLTTDNGDEQAFIRVSIQIRGSSADGACTVRTVAPGWTGCACLRPDGLPEEGRVCTVECTLETCGNQGVDVPATPDEWMTAEIPKSLQTEERSVRAGAAPAGLAPLSILAFAAVLVF